MARRNEPGMVKQSVRPQRSDGAVADEHSGDNHPAGSGSYEPQRPGLGQLALAMLMLRDDGWLRIVPHELGKVVYFKWKFTRGRWTNHYVMYRCDDSDYLGALEGLLGKLEEVDAGVRRAALDTPYS